MCRCLYTQSKGEQGSFLLKVYSYGEPLELACTFDEANYSLPTFCSTALIGEIPSNLNLRVYYHPLHAYNTPNKQMYYLLMYMIFISYMMSQSSCLLLNYILSIG